ncbi:hypothetical protein BJV77DRAFT_975535 [Russula vinacea]|nr:hypothetical protein BJV77DRAFT_975535 [Russula vinacea]
MDAKSSLRNRSRRNRFSVSRLSTDSTATLPAYPRPEISPDDRPPDYPESADEADADTSHPLPTTPSSRSPHPPDPYLDSLLARSVHALEMSNALLQSSISTHSSLSAVLAADSPVVESSLEARARNLSSRIGTNSSVQADWLDDLAVISEHFATDARPDALGLSLAHDDPVSRSLPLRSSSRHHRNRSAESTEPDEPHLRLSNWPRSRLISPAPRAITQYVEANADPDTILLPSTLGLRSTPSAHLPPRSPSPPPPPSPGPSSPLSCPTPPEPSSTRRPSTSSISRPPTSFRFGHRPRASSHAPSTAPPARSRASKRPMTPPLIPPSLVLTTRPLTPPTENPSLSSLSSSSSNPSLQALRKILDDQPNASPMSRAQSDGHATRRPTFLPRTPLPAPTLGTSTATASVSRLFTKPVHMHSGSSSREPRPSALKGGLRTPQSPASSDGFLAPSSTGPGGSSGSSARSTPKRISFADLPEPYGSERGGGGSGRGGKGKGKGKGKSRVDVEDDSDESDDDDFEKGWWARLLLGSGQVRGLSLGRPEDRIEARIARGLGSRGGFGGGMEDWAI